MALTSWATAAWAARTMDTAALVEAVAKALVFVWRTIVALLLPRGTAWPFDVCLITSSDPARAQLYRELLRRRRVLLGDLQCRVYSDPPAGRVGSGGGTILALATFLQEELGDLDSVDGIGVEAFLSRHRILILHAGGESRRLPCFVPEGKLFAPVPAATPGPAGAAPVILDLVLGLYRRYPWSARGEVIVASGDAIVDFDTTTLEGRSPLDHGVHLCGVAKACSLEQGSHHGVFELDMAEISTATPTTAPLRVRAFHQKSTVRELRASACINSLALDGDDTERCALDVGVFCLSPRYCRRLVEFARQPLPEAPGSDVMAALGRAELFMDLYLEMVSAGVYGPRDGEVYTKAMLSRGSKLPSSLLLAFHSTFCDLPLNALLPRQARFTHFGSLREYPEACRGMVNWSPSTATDDVLVLNSSGVQLHRPADEQAHGAVFVEMCSNCTLHLSSGRHFFVGLADFHLAAPLPPGLCLDGRRLRLGPAKPELLTILVYHVADTFKAVATCNELVFCGSSLMMWLEDRNIAMAQVLPAGANGFDLWSMKLFCHSPAADVHFLRGYWDPTFVTPAWTRTFLKMTRISFREANQLDDVLQRDALRTSLRGAMDECSVERPRPSTGHTSQFPAGVNGKSD